jgi:hypothetical protein
MENESYDGETDFGGSTEKTPELEKVELETKTEYDSVALQVEKEDKLE